MIHNFNNDTEDPNAEWHLKLDAEEMVGARATAVDGVVSDDVTIPNANRVLDGRVQPKGTPAEELQNNHDNDTPEEEE